jgi:hypothetical protein
MPAITVEVVWDVIAQSATDAVTFTRFTHNTSTADIEKRPCSKSFREHNP